MCPHFIEVFNSNGCILDSTFSALSPANILRYSQTCRSSRVATSVYFRRNFNINRRLGRFFNHPTQFRSLQARTGTLISGSFALQFFDRSLYPDSDLDVYVDYRYSREVGFWLVEAEGYEFRPAKGKKHATFGEALRQLHSNQPPSPESTGLTERIGDNPYFMRGVGAVFNFIKKSHDESQELKVQVITASTTPLEIILQFHSSKPPSLSPHYRGSLWRSIAVVMNIISYEKAYSLYPRATFEERRSLICATLGPHQEPARQKYIVRGWTMLYSVTQAEQNYESSAFRTGLRRIGDRFSWIIPLSLEGVDLARPRNLHINSFPCDNLAAHTWCLSHPIHPDDELEDATPKMVFKFFVSPVLRYHYIVADRNIGPEIYELVCEAEHRKKMKGAIRDVDR
jgi:hypothetical protein